MLNRTGLAPETLRTAAGWQLVQGSNRDAEFSGWQEGLDVLGESAAHRSGVVFVNDSVCTHRHFSLARQIAFVRTLRTSVGCNLVGFQDSADRRALSIGPDVDLQLTIAGMELPAWTSTYCFALTWQALKKLQCRLYDPALVEECVPGGASETTFFRRLSPHLDEHVRSWIFGGGWYGSRPLSPENAAQMQMKARSIAAEFLLSARCRAVGIEARDPFRLHPRLARWDRASIRLARALSRLPLRSGR